jgi:hypothetical protein
MQKILLYTKFFTALIENIHDNQLSNLFINIINKVDCQYIMPVLKDKPSQTNCLRYKILC